MNINDPLMSLTFDPNDMYKYWSYCGTKNYAMVGRVRPQVLSNCLAYVKKDKRRYHYSKTNSRQRYLKKKKRDDEIAKWRKAFEEAEKKNGGPLSGNQMMKFIFSEPVTFKSE